MIFQLTKKSRCFFFCILFVLKEIQKVLFLNPDFVGIYELLRTNTCKRRFAGIASLDCSWCWHVLTIWNTKLNKYNQDALSRLSLSSCLLKTNSSRKCPFQFSVNSTIGVSTEKDWALGMLTADPLAVFQLNQARQRVSVMWSTSVGFIRRSSTFTALILTC